MLLKGFEGVHGLAGSNLGLICGINSLNSGSLSLFSSLDDLTDGVEFSGHGLRAKFNLLSFDGDLGCALGDDEIRVLESERLETVAVHLNNVLLLGSSVIV